jgi:hypothetical protein
VFGPLERVLGKMFRPYTAVLMEWKPGTILRRFFDPERGGRWHLYSRWIFLRALGLIYFSAFYSLVFQIRGLIGPNGILPAAEYLHSVAEQAGAARYWYAPTMLWISSGPHMLTALCWAGMLASLLLAANLWPRGMLAVCFAAFLSFVAAAGEFSGYQSDSMLLEAGFISLFFAPPGFRPGLGTAHPPSRASRMLLVWECFRIYFESGVAKIISGDPQWRHFTAMDEYYQNGPLPTWIGWYAQQLPHWWHAFTAFLTLTVELALVWMMFLWRPLRIAIFFVVSALQIGIALTANYTFLNYLVFSLGIILLDDDFWTRFVPPLRRRRATSDSSGAVKALDGMTRRQAAKNGGSGMSASLRAQIAPIKLALKAVMLSWLFFASTAELIWMLKPIPLPTTPVAVLQPFRIADRYGLFASMTSGRYEIEFQGSNDGRTWLPYPFRYKPQDPAKAPGIYAPYQPRFDWNLWFASLSSWRSDPITVRTEERLLTNDRDVLELFAGNPFPKAPPLRIRAVIWEYWFTTKEQRKQSGLWWRRQMLGLYAPVLERNAGGGFTAVQLPTAFPTPQE